MLLQILGLLSLLIPFYPLVAAVLQKRKGAYTFGSSVILFVVIFNSVSSYCRMLERYIVTDPSQLRGSMSYVCEDSIYDLWFPAAYLLALALTAIYLVRKRRNAQAQ